MVVGERQELVTLCLMAVDVAIGGKVSYLTANGYKYIIMRVDEFKHYGYS
jgi:hypothetical protein